MKDWLQNLYGQVKEIYKTLRRSAFDEAISPETPPERLQELSAMSRALAYIVAQNPSTPPDLLASLSIRSDENIVKAVLQNPNTPIEILLSLSWKHPQSFHDNPILPLLLLENPNFLAGIRNLGVLFIAERPHPLICEFAAKSNIHDFRKKAAAHPKTPPPLLRMLIADPIKEVSEAARENPSLPDELQSRFKALRSPGGPLPTEELTALAGLGKWPCAWVIASKRTPPDLIRPLMKDFSLDVCLAALSHPETPSSLIEEILQTFLGDRSLSMGPYSKEGVLRAIAQHPACLSEQLSLIVKSSYREARCVAARHPALSSADIEHIASCPDRNARVALAERKDLPLEIQLRLSEDGDEQVRSRVASRYPETTKERKRWRQEMEEGRLAEAVLRGFAARGDAAAFSVLLYPGTSEALCTEIAQKAGQEFSQLLCSCEIPPKKTEFLASLKNTYIHTGLVKNQGTPEPILVQIALSGEQPIRTLLFSLRQTNAVLAALVKAGFAPAVERLARNKSATEAQLSTLLESAPTPWKRLAVLLCRAPALPTRALDILLPRYWEHLTSHPRLPEWCQQPEVVARFPKAMLRRLRKNPALAPLLDLPKPDAP